MGNEEKMTRFMQIRKIVVREFLEVKTIDYQLAKGKNLWFYLDNGFVIELIIDADNNFIKSNIFKLISKIEINLIYAFASKN